MVNEKVNVLVIDDDIFVRQVLNDVLDMENYPVSTAESMDEGLGVLREKGDFRIVFTDYMIDGQSGVDIAREIKQYDPGTVVVLATGWDITLTDELREQGVDMVLRKPFNVTAIMDIMSQAEEILERGGEGG